MRSRSDRGAATAGRSSRGLTLAIVVVAALLLAMTAFASATVADAVRSDADARYADSVDVTISSLRQGLSEVESALVALRVLFVGSDAVTAQEFSRAVDETAVYDRTPATREFRYFAALADGTFRPEFASVNQDAAAPGWVADLSQMPAAGKAMTSGGVEASPPLALPDGSRQIVVLLGVMEGGVRQGLVAVTVDVETLVRGTELASSPVRIDDGGVLVFGPTQMDAAPIVERHLSFGDRDWHLAIAGGPEADTRTTTERVLPALVAVVGLIVTVVVTALLLWLRRSLDRSRRLAVALTSSEQEMRFRALHDPLTGLANRTLFEDRLHHALEAQRRRRNRTAVLYCDLDTFKVINDHNGHEAGDAVLVATAQRLSEAVRAADTVARMGGDEFCILLEEVSGADEVLRVAGRVRAEVSRPLDIAGSETHTTVSIGAAMSGPDPADPASLIREADTAMYRAKQAGRDRIILVDVGTSSMGGGLDPLRTTSL